MSAKTKTRKAAADLGLLPPGSRPAVTLPALPLVERTPNARGGLPAVSVTDAGLEAITMLAADGAPQTKCASALGISAKTFQSLMGKDGDERVRLAYERGHADLEYEVSHLLLNAARAGNVIAAIFYAKAQLGWSEQAAPSTQVGIVITLPDALDRASYEKRIASRPAEIIVEAPVEVPAPPAPAPEPRIKVTEPEDRRVDDGPPQNTHVSPLVIARAKQQGGPVR